MPNRFCGTSLESHPSIVHEDVNTPMLLLDKVPEPHNRLLLANVEHMELWGEPLLVELRDSRLAPHLVPRGEIHVTLEPVLSQLVKTQTKNVWFMRNVWFWKKFEYQILNIVSYRCYFSNRSNSVRKLKIQQI